MVFQSAIARGFTCFDFLRGNEPYKYRFGATDTPTLSIACSHRLFGARGVSMRRAPAASPRRVAMFSVHSCPLATLGGRETGGMNVYVRELSRHLGQHDIPVDVYTRRQDPCCQPWSISPPTPASFISMPDPPRPMTNIASGATCQNLSRAYSVLSLDMPSAMTCSIVIIGFLDGWRYSYARRLQVPMVHMSHTLGAAKNVAAQQPWEQVPRRLRIEQEILRYGNAVIAESPATSTR